MVEYIKKKLIFDQNKWSYKTGNRVKNKDWIIVGHCCIKIVQYNMINGYMLGNYYNNLKFNKKLWNKQKIIGLKLQYRNNIVIRV